MARRRIKPAALPSVNLGLEIGIALFTASVIEAKACLLSLLDERERTDAPPLVNVAAPDGSIEQLYAPDAYVRLTDDAMACALGRFVPVKEPSPTSAAIADEQHLSAHHEI
jgi:hypothetical protein